MGQIREKTGLNSFTLKMMAVLSMVIDHVGILLFTTEIIDFSQYLILRKIGRLAYPIFAYLLVEGFIYTHDVRSYILRMGSLAVLSEIPFDLLNTGKILEFGHQNVFFTLTLGLLMLCFFVEISGNVGRYSMVIVMFLVGEFLHTDYSSMGLLMILCFYLYRERIWMKTVFIVVINILLMGGVQMYGALAMIPISLHNRQQGPKAKTFFYAFYPVHLLVLFVIKMIL